MRSFKGHLLTESSTADATNTEMAICLMYNMDRLQSNKSTAIRGRGDRIKKGLELAGIKEKKWFGISDGKRLQLMKIGAEVVKDSKLAWGTYLSHAGTSSATNHYKTVYKLRAGDTTSKSDFTSTTDSSWNISLKKSGDGGPGAQIMSSKAGEAEGVFKAGIGHYQNTGGRTLDAVTIQAMDKLWADMAASANNRLVIQVSGGKKDFANWYKQANHSRRQQLANLKPSPSKKQLDAHLDAEMDLLGIPSLARNPVNTKKKLLYNLIDKKTKKNLFTVPKTFKKLESTRDVSKLIGYENEYKNDSSWTVGSGYTIKGDGTAVQTKSGRVGKAAVVINPEHLGSNYEKVLADNDSLKRLITSVVNTSIATKDWAEDLEAFYKDDDELKKWFLYEAGSGLFKFTGTYSTGSPYKSKMSPVANKLVVFDNSGVAHTPVTILDWAAANTSALSAGGVQISYKTSGLSGSAVIRLAAHYESELPLLQEEIRTIKSQYMLNEGVFSWVKDKVSTLLNKIKDAVKAFVARVIKKFIDGLKKLVAKSQELFLDTMGINGSVHIPAPSW